MTNIKDKDKNAENAEISVEIPEYDPQGIDPNTPAEITCDVPPGLKEKPRSLVCSGGCFDSDTTGESFAATSTDIIDTENYTSFSIGTGGLPEGEYTFYIYLRPRRGRGNTYHLASDFPLVVSPPKPKPPARITRILPNSIKVSELKKTTFTIFGSHLDNIETGTAFYLRTLAYKFIYQTRLTETSVKVRYSSTSSTPEPGNYKVLAKSGGGEPVFSTATLRIEADE